MMKWMLIACGLCVSGCAFDPTPPMSQREYRKKDLQIQRADEAYEPPVR